MRSFLHSYPIIQLCFQYCIRQRVSPSTTACFPKGNTYLSSSTRSDGLQARLAIANKQFPDPGSQVDLIVAALLIIVTSIWDLYAPFPSTYSSHVEFLFSCMLPLHIPPGSMRLKFEFPSSVFLLVGANIPHYHCYCCLCCSCCFRWRCFRM